MISYWHWSDTERHRLPYKHFAIFVSLSLSLGFYSFMAITMTNACQWTFLVLQIGEINLYSICRTLREHSVPVVLLLNLVCIVFSLSLWLTNPKSFILWNWIWSGSLDVLSRSFELKKMKFTYLSFCWPHRECDPSSNCSHVERL